MFGKFLTRKLAAVVGGLVVVLAVLYLSRLYPPPQKEDVQGAIGQREVYREAQMTPGDVTADVGAGGASLEGFLHFLRSPEFKSMSQKSAFKEMAGHHEAFSELIGNKVFASLVNQTMRQGSQEQLSRVAGVLTNHSQALSKLSRHREFANALGRCSSFSELRDSPEIQSLVNSDPELANLFSNQQFADVMNDVVFFSLLRKNAPNLNELSSMIQNAAFGVLFTNPQGSLELFGNPAFSNLVNQNMFGIFSQIQALQGNQAFLNLVGDSSFLSLMNSPDFHSLATNADFQQFVKDAGSQGSRSQSLVDLANQSQYRVLFNQPAFQNLLNNASFASVIRSADFGTLISQNNFGSLVFNQDFIANAQNSQSLSNLVNQSQQLNITF